MRSALIISFSNSARDPRVQRQIEWLSATHRLTVVGLGKLNLPSVEFIELVYRPSPILRRISRLVSLIRGSYDRFYFGTPLVVDLTRHIRGRQFDVVVANDIDTLPAALALFPRDRVLFDAHEYYPGSYAVGSIMEKPYRRYYYFLCKKYMPQAGRSITVSSSISEKYRTEFGISSPKIVLNCPDYSSFIAPKGVNPDSIRIVHHGAADKDRNLEKMIDVARHLDRRFTLHFFLVGETGYIEKLKRYASSIRNVSFHDPVTTKEIPNTINNFDIGLFILPPRTTSYEYALPNKFFEFIQARLAVAIGPSEEMKKLVTQYDCGVISEDFSPEKMAYALNALTPEKIYQMKLSSDKLARLFNSEYERENFLRVVSQFYSGPMARCSG